MRNKIFHILIVNFLLMMIITGKVGIHFFHHHEAESSTHSISEKKSQAETPSYIGTEEEECPLCSLDLFHELWNDIITFFFSIKIPHFFYLSHFYFCKTTSFLFHQGRAPPVF